MKWALICANQSKEIVRNWDTNTNSTANCLRHTVFRNSSCHPGCHDAVPFPYIKATQYQAPKARHQCLLGYYQLWFSCGGFFVGSASVSKRKKTFLVVLRISSTTLLSLHSRHLEVVSARKNGCARRRHAKGLPLPSHVSLWCARPFLRPLLPSTCYAGYTL